MSRSFPLGLLLLALASVGPAGAAQFDIPMHAPPKIGVLGRSAGTAYGLSLGAMHASAPDLSVDGPGGGWEIAMGTGERSAVVIHSEGFVFHGRQNPVQAGSRGTGGLTGTVEADFARGLGGAGVWSMYGGALANLTLMDVADPLNLKIQGGKLYAEPDMAYSIVLGFPLGLRWRSAAGRRGEARAAVFGVGYAGGSTLFSYTGAPPGAFGRSRHIDANAALGGRIGAEIVAWRLALDAGGSISASGGNNDALSCLSGVLSWRF